jgi:hypothetical protein
MFTAHSFVKSCKTKLMARVEDLDELRRQLGECLYVVQSFYSNTNWVEMFGGVSYPNFGKKNKIMLHSRSIRFLPTKTLCFKDSETN